MLAPVLVATVLTLLAFGLVSLSSDTFDAALTATLDSAIAIFLGVVVFTITFGLAGVLVLWALRQPGLVVWALTGILSGAVAGIILGEFSARGVSRGMLIVFAGMGSILFLMIRLLAGIQGQDDT